MRKFLLGSVALVALIASPAMAADLPLKAPPVIQPEAWSWTGFYIGAHVGSLWGTKDIRIASGDALVDSQTAINGWLGGGQIGYNYQVARWVWGIEAQFSWANADGASLCNVVAINNCFVHANWLGTVAGRLGWTIDHALVFVKGGGAWVHDKYETNIEGDQTTTATASETRWGWMFGTGVEYAFTPNWSGKIEYDYLDFGTRNIVFANAVNAAIDAPVTIKERIHLIKFGINYRFGYSPVYAKY